MRSDKPWFYAQAIPADRLQYVDLDHTRIHVVFKQADGVAWIVWSSKDARDYSVSDTCLRYRKKREAIEHCLLWGNWDGSPDLWTKILPLKLKYGLIDEELKDGEGN